MTENMYIATVAWSLLVLGVFLRRTPRLHIPVMLTSLAIDFSLLVYLQITRSAVQTAAEFSLSPLQMSHIGCSTLAVILYFPVLMFGFRLKKNPSDLSIRIRHRRFALSAFIFRTLGFVFMFSMIK